MLIEIPTFTLKMDAGRAIWTPDAITSINPQHVVTVSALTERAHLHQFGGRSHITMSSVTSNQNEDGNTVDSDSYTSPWTREQVHAAVNAAAD